MPVNTLLNTTVAIRNLRSPRYPAFPYDPPRSFPEFSTFDMRLDPTNEVYQAVRDLLIDLQLDPSNIDRPNWNPLGQFIRRGQRVLIKPNWVFHTNRLDGSIESLVTHTSLIRTVIDYVILALDQVGTIEIADAPIQGCDFSELMKRNMVLELIEMYRSTFPQMAFSVLDLRKTILHSGRPWITGLESQSSSKGDPRGYELIDLHQNSLLTDIQDRSERFRVTMYDHRLMRDHHDSERHEYLVANSVLSADFIVNLPKLKCHIKAGITGALKNLVGINGHKEFLPHHTNGSPMSGGDQYRYRSRIKPLVNLVYDDHWAHASQRTKVRNVLETQLIRALRQPSKLFDRDRMFDGGWSGNDTIPRTTLDLNHVLYFYDQETGALSATQLRNVLHIVDGVIAGDGYGPLWPTSKDSAILMAGWNPLTLDACGAAVIGLDPLKVKLINHGFTHRMSRLLHASLSPRDIQLDEDGVRKSAGELASRGFAIPKEWQDAIL